MDKNLIRECMLSPSWLNGNYNVCGYSVHIDSRLSFICFENTNQEECYCFQGDEGDKVIGEINVIYNTYTCDEDSLTQGQAIEKWIINNL